MKRSPNYKKVNKIHTWLSWNYCSKCNMEFRREDGWSMRFDKPVPGYDSFTYPIYVCAECCPTVADAYEFLIDKHANNVTSFWKMKNRPIAPPTGSSLVEKRVPKLLQQEKDEESDSS